MWASTGSFPRSTYTDLKVLGQAFAGFSPRCNYTDQSWFRGVGVCFLRVSACGLEDDLMALVCSDYISP